MIKKPEHNAPCNNCGECCKEGLCQIAILFIGTHYKKCPVLYKDGDRYLCGAIVDPKKYILGLETKTEEEIDNMRRMFKVMVRVGDGCN